MYLLGGPAPLTGRQKDKHTHPVLLEPKSEQLRNALKQQFNKSSICLIFLKPFKMAPSLFTMITWPVCRMLCAMLNKRLTIHPHVRKYCKRMNSSTYRASKARRRKEKLFGYFHKRGRNIKHFQPFSMS